MTEREFLEWLHDEFSEYSLGVKQGSKRKSSEYPSENYSQTWVWSTKSSPVFNSYSDWYIDGGKRFPDDLSLTPLKLKVWYCCDGHYCPTPIGTPNMLISNYAQQERRRLFERIFQEQKWMVKFSEGQLRFGTAQSQRILEWMGDPLPGFEHKWPSQKRGES
ncbi:LAGLIDADG endonuclease [Halovirus HCTV-5]|uniref:homing endonuclease with LAGLIDADG motif n=1 Tax=Halovirus HCTV-5 TaxID=1273748 RepID=UPI0003348397|nr:homing endonuclease with LAGLIDADG motif [Halovirus HCTV-5]AGM11691.1 LAGLIDADG endonuclease [Halovirus HCTV-5]